MSSDNQPDAIGIDNLPREFTTALPKARAAIFWERAYPRLVPPGVVTALFASASFAGVWGVASPAQRMAGVAGFALALAISVVRPPKSYRTETLRVSKREAAQRLDAHSPRPVKLAEMMIDQPAQNTPDEIEKFNHHLSSVWNKYRGPFVVGKPKLDMAARDPLRLHIAAAVLTAVTALLAQAPHGTLLQQAFDWDTPTPAKAPPAPPAPMRLKAWVQPPEGIDIRPLEMNETSSDKDVNGTVLRAHQGSVLTIMTYNKKPTIAINGQDIAVKQEITVDEKNKTYQFEIALEPGQNKITITDGPAWIIDTRVDLPPQTSIHGIHQKEQRGRKTFDIDYDAKDDYGCQGEIVIESLHKSAAGDTPLPSAQIPRIPVPCRN